MIRQIITIKTKTAPLPFPSRDFLKARQIQSRIKTKAVEPKPNHGYLFSPMTAGPVLVPVTRWIE